MFLVVANLGIAQPPLLLQLVEQRVGLMLDALVVDGQRIVHRLERIVVVHQRSKLAGQRIALDREIVLHLLDLQEVDRRQGRQNQRHDDDHDLQTLHRLVGTSLAVRIVAVGTIVVVRTVALGIVLRVVAGMAVLIAVVFHKP